MVDGEGKVVGKVGKGKEDVGKREGIRGRVRERESKWGLNRGRRGLGFGVYCSPAFAFFATFHRSGARLNHPVVNRFDSLVAQEQAKPVVAIPRKHVCFRNIIRICTDWPPMTPFSSIPLYRNQEINVEKGISLRHGNVDCVCTSSGGVCQAANAWIVVVP